MSDNIAFKQFELEGWKQCVTAYDEIFRRLTSLAIPSLLKAVGVKPGMKLLDIATGPGALAASAAASGAEVVAVDFSPEMIACARSYHGETKSITFVVGDAENLDFPSDCFDAVTMSFGILHLAHPDRAVAEAFRVMKPGGVFAFTVWAPPREAKSFDVVHRAVEMHGDKSVILPEGPPFFKYSDASIAEQELYAAGFESFMTETLSLSWELTSAEELFHGILHGTARTGGLLRAQPESALAAIRSQIVNEIRSRFSTDRQSIAVPMPAILYWAKK